MATTRRSTRADSPDYVPEREAHAAGPQPTDCAACHAPLPPDHRYLCAACVEDSARRAEEMRARRAAEYRAPVAAPETPDTMESDDPNACPNCGMALDASGRCAGCVTTIRR